MTGAPLPEQRWVKPYPTTPGHWKKQLPAKALALAIKGDVPALESLLSVNPEALHKRGPHGRTLLWEAARRGHVDAIDWLLARGADPLATGCYNGESVVQLTPYCAAVYYRRPAAAELLASAGAATLDIFRAAFMGAEGEVDRALSADPALIDAEDPHDEIYFTPVIAFAVAGGQQAVVKQLVERGAEVARYSAQLLRIGLTARQSGILHYLFDHGLEARHADAGIFQICDDFELLKDLVERGASTVHVVNGFPPVVFVARGDKGEHPERVAFLLDHGADIDAAGGPDRRTALHYAAAAGHERVAAVLLERGAAPSLPDKSGLTAADLALTRGHAALARRLREAASE
jgi:hypothetical protein